MHDIFSIKSMCIVCLLVATLQIDPQDIASQPSFRGEALLARHGAFEDAVVKNRDTYDYLLKTDPSRSSRVLSVVEVKRV